MRTIGCCEPGSHWPRPFRPLRFHFVFFQLLHNLEYGTGPFQRFMMRKMFCTTEMFVENARICCQLVVVRAAASAFCRFFCTFFFFIFKCLIFFSVHRVCMVKEPEDKRPKLIVFIRILFQFFFLLSLLFVFPSFFFFFSSYSIVQLRCIFFMVTIRFEWLLILENYLFGS